MCASSTSLPIRRSRRTTRRSRRRCCARSDETQLALRANNALAPRLERQRGRLATPAGGGRLSVKARGSFDGLAIEPADAQPPGPGEVTLAVRAAGLNFRDVLNVLGAYPGDPGALGGEAAGTVVAVGEGVRHLRVGDRAFGLVTGGFSRDLTTTATMLRRLPEPLDFAGGATIPVTFATALAAFDLAGLKAGERVLIHAGAGGVGLAAIALAKALGAEVIATASAGNARCFIISASRRFSTAVPPASHWTFITPRAALASMSC